MESLTKKPRMVFFQWDHSKLSKFLLLHTQLHVKCLSEFFEVVVISRDCDYQQVCDTYHPDITLFESGWKSSVSKKLKIKNTSSYPEIPKLGFHNGDPWCDCRPGFISDMEHWGTETFFSISTTMAEHTPEITENLFVWPNFIDNEIYRDYGHAKVIPILFTGSMISLYPWRQKIHSKISNSFPTLSFPHLGYENRTSMMIHGEQYARTINSSWFVPACGTVAKEVVRKHFEVPGSKSCLITEKSPALEAAGFVDMENCIFADEKDVLDKLDYLFKNIHELEKIINAGYELVHSHHTFKQRDQIFQWFNLHKNLKSNEKIIQSNPFESLRVVRKSSDFKTTPIMGKGQHLEFLRKGDEKLWAGKYNEAEAQYLKSLCFISSMCEPKLKLTICNLYKGHVEDAFKWIIQPIQYNLGIYGTADPDPVEWAYYIIYLLCSGKINEAIIRSKQFPLINHTELHRVRLVVNFLQTKEVNELYSESASLKSRHSIHQLPQISFTVWISNLSNMLKACDQLEYSERVNALISLNGRSTEELKKNHKKSIWLLNSRVLSIYIICTNTLNHIFEVLNIPTGRRGLPSITIGDYVFRLLKWVKNRSGISFNFRD